MSEPNTLYNIYAYGEDFNPEYHKEALTLSEYHYYTQYYEAQGLKVRWTEAFFGDGIYE